MGKSQWSSPAHYRLAKQAREIERLRELLRECQVYVEGMSSVDSELCERVERELSDESNRK